MGVTMILQNKKITFLNGLCLLMVGTAIIAMPQTAQAQATGLNAATALKAAPTSPAPTANQAALQDPAVQAAAALSAQNDLQAAEGSNTGTPTATTGGTTTPSGAAPQTTPQAAPTATQMGVASGATATPTAPATSPADALSNTLSPPPLDGTQMAGSDQTIPPLTPATPGMDLPVEPEKSPEEMQAELRQDAFKAASESLIPLKPDEIRKIKEMMDENKLAIQTPTFPSPKPESTFTTISLDPGQPPVELKTAMGNVTTLSILDGTGQPWPIQDISWAGNFEVQQPEQGSNMLRITPMSEFANGNVSMRLIGLTPPVIFSLKTDRRAVQVRADVQIPQNGPNATPAPIQAKPTITTSAGDLGMTQILEGVPPVQAKKMKVTGIDGRSSAYDVNGITYLRTPYTLISPAWNASVRSADGTTVYAMKYTPVLLLSDKGQMVKARLQKVESDDE